MKIERLKNIAGGEKGSTLILALLVMVVLSLLGVTAMTSSSTDISVAKNQDVYNRNFALAEAAARLGALALKNNPYVPQEDDPASVDEFTDSEMPVWMYKGDQFEDWIKHPITWTHGVEQRTIMGEVVKFKVRYDSSGGGVTTIDATGDDFISLERYTIFGRSHNDGGEVIVQLGYQLAMLQSDKDKQSD